VTDGVNLESFITVAASDCAARMRAQFADAPHLIDDLDDEALSLMWLWQQRRSLPPEQRAALAVRAPNLSAALDQLDVEMRAAAAIHDAYAGRRP
jgi:hypothetical protein